MTPFMHSSIERSTLLAENIAKSNALWERVIAAQACRPSPTRRELLKRRWMALRRSVGLWIADIEEDDLDG